MFCFWASLSWMFVLWSTCGKYAVVEKLGSPGSAEKAQDETAELIPAPPSSRSSDQTCFCRCDSMQKEWWEKSSPPLCRYAEKLLMIPALNQASVIRLWRVTPDSSHHSVATVTAVVTQTGWKGAVFKCDSSVLLSTGVFCFEPSCYSSENVVWGHAHPGATPHHPANALPQNPHVSW